MCKKPEVFQEVCEEHEPSEVLVPVALSVLFDALLLLEKIGFKVELEGQLYTHGPRLRIGV